MTVLNYLNDLEHYFPYNHEHTSQTPLVIRKPLKRAQKTRLSKIALPNGQYRELPLAGSRLPIDPFLFNSREGKILHGVLQKLVETEVIAEQDIPQYIERLQKKLSNGTCAGETFAVNVASSSETIFNERLDTPQQQRMAMCVHIFRTIKKDIHEKEFEYVVQLALLKSQIENKEQTLKELQTGLKDPSVESLSLAFQEMSLEASTNEKTRKISKKIHKKSSLKDNVKDKLRSLRKMKDQLSNFTKITYDKAELKMTAYEPVAIKKETEGYDIAKILLDIELHLRNPKTYSILLSLSYKPASISSHRISIQINPLIFYDLKIGKVAYDSKEALYRDLVNYFQHYNVTGVGLKVMSKTISMRE